ncbi:MAG: aspartate carbamoyltransferase regulatory subunit [Candidatus Magasanikbacteria bacterium]|nr:aspartate carbamoyltransferase regulatory subunit [Candidatus Magasanikbacteria bacterium]
MQQKTLSVSAIKNGTVVDHIPAGAALTIIRLLNLPQGNKQVTVGLNLPSRATIYKDLIKVEERELTEDEANRVALLAPRATINIIKNYTVVKKFHVKIPENIHRVVVCPNPTCITNQERMATTFRVETKLDRVSLRCLYCEKIFAREDIKEYLT